MNAAVADYRPDQVYSEKIKDSRSQLDLKLVPNPDILKEMSASKTKKQITIGFALETQNAIEFAQKKLIHKNCDLLVLNSPIQNSHFDSSIMPCAIFQRGDSLLPQIENWNRYTLAHKVYLGYLKCRQDLHENH
jgi:hypothetical protein